MEEDTIALPSRSDASSGFPGATPGSVDGRAISLEPRPHLLETDNLSGLDLTIRHRPDVEEKVAVACRTIDKGLEAFAERF